MSRLECIQINQLITCLKPTHLGTYPKTVMGTVGEPSMNLQCLEIAHFCGIVVIEPGYQDTF